VDVGQLRHSPKPGSEAEVVEIDRTKGRCAVLEGCDCQKPARDTSATVLLSWRCHPATWPRKSCHAERVLYLIIVTPFILGIGFMILWTVSHREPNQGWERDDSLFPQLGEAIPRQPPERPPKASP
jgi:hypothetical protein